jgi:serine/threonine-protein kinase
MERLYGYDLAHYLRKHRRVDLKDVRQLITAIAQGVDAAREAGIVHRDLKPQNVFRARSGEIDTWKILDFGVSKLEDSAGTLTQGNVVGTPAYMSPEQARGEDADHRADVYAIAAIAYRALTGQPPFSGRDTPRILHSVIYDAPAQPTLLDATLPDDVDLVLAIGLAVDRNDRFDRATELASAISTALEQTLPPELRERGRRAVAKRPWMQSK